MHFIDFLYQVLLVLPSQVVLAGAFSLGSLGELHLATN